MLFGTHDSLRSLCVAHDEYSMTSNEQSRPIVLVALWEGVELLDWAGPFEVFAQVRDPDDDDQRAFDVRTVTVDGGPVKSQKLVSVTPDHSTETAPGARVVVIPGANTHNARDDGRFMAWAGRACADAEIVLSVCTGALVLADLGLLDGISATTHYASIGILREAAPRTDVLEGVRFVDAGNVVTPAGVRAGNDGALHVVGRLVGEEGAARTARFIEWDSQGAEGQRGGGAKG